MQRMRIKDGYYAGFAQYRDVSILFTEIAADTQKLNQLLKQGYIEVEFAYVFKLPLNHLWYEPGFPKMMAKM